MKSCTCSTRNNIYYNEYLQLLSLIIISVLARLFFVKYILHDARSTDLYAWENVANLLAIGKNPYNETSQLNWPPFWMQLVFTFNFIAKSLHAHFYKVVQFFLISIESLIICLLYFIHKLFFIDSNHKLKSKTMFIFFTLLFGICLNPIAIFLVTAHGNFDVLLIFFTVLSLLFILLTLKTSSKNFWLLSSAFLGLAILTKTIPVILIPIVFFHFFKRFKFVESLLSIYLIGLPVVLGMSIIYVLGPEQITNNVLHYKSISGYFGITGLMEVFNQSSWIGWYEIFFSRALAILLIILTFTLTFKRKLLSAKQIVLLYLLSFLTIIIFGPGYGPQYGYWCIPFLVLTFSFVERKFKVLIIIFYIVAAITYTIEYGVGNSFGGWLISLCTNCDLASTLNQLIDGKINSTLFRLPLFLSYIMIYLSLSTRSRLCH
ncbi:MAG: hypothetical protein HQK49_11615 [Oligoflexia bacterium]|nr:hypothetical protein [Oligoflexia bacterium]